MTVPIVVSPNGTTRALEDVTIRARVRGFLKERHFAEGAMVKKGQLLLVIDEEPYQVDPPVGQGPADRGLRRAEARPRNPRGARSPAAQLELDRAQLLLAQLQERRFNRTLVARRAPARPRTWTRPRPTARRWESQVEADRAQVAQAKADYDRGDRLGPGAGLGGQGGGPRRRAEPGLLPDACPARRPDRRGPREGRQPRRAGPGRAAGPSPTWPTIQQLDPMGVDIRLSSRDLDRTTRPDHGRPGRPPLRPGPRGRSSIPRRAGASSSTTRSTRRPRPSWSRPDPQPRRQAPARRVRQGQDGGRPAEERRGGPRACRSSSPTRGRSSTSSTSRGRWPSGGSSRARPTRGCGSSPRGSTRASR